MIHPKGLQVAGIFSLPETKDQALFIQFIVECLCIHNFDIFIARSTINRLSNFNIDLKRPVLDDHLDNVHFIFSLGGDGTVLRAVHFVSSKNIPIVGINTGRLGFLADIKKQDIDSVLLELKAGQYIIEERATLKSSSNISEDTNALNEVSIQKRGNASLLTIDAFINQKYLSSFWADGIIVATPTGSTAYSLSLGGPIISPNTDAIIINPIAPHTLTVRPIIVPGDSQIQLKVSGREMDYTLSHDSDQTDSNKKLNINIIKSESPALFIKLNEYNYYSTLREKLMWGADIRN